MPEHFGSANTLLPLFNKVDMDYTRGVAADKRPMSVGQIGRRVLKFYGLWTFKLPLVS
jgi:hypothetical protein